MGTGKMASVIIIFAHLVSVDAWCRHSETLPLASSRAARLDVYLVDGSSVPFLTVAAGKRDAARIFAQIGVSLLWHAGNPPKEAGPGVIQISIGRAPANAASGALGATLLPGFTITLYLDRIQELQARIPTAGSVLFGYVLAHEIGHVLQGTPRHSEVGILRGRWSGDDYAKMSALRLTFTPGDVEQIWRGPVLNQKLSTHFPVD